VPQLRPPPVVAAMKLVQWYAKLWLKFSWLASTRSAAASADSAAEAMTWLTQVPQSPWSRTALTRFTPALT